MNASEFRKKLASISYDLDHGHLSQDESLFKLKELTESLSKTTPSDPQDYKTVRSGYAKATPILTKISDEEIEKFALELYPDEVENIIRKRKIFIQHVKRFLSKLSTQSSLIESEDTPEFPISRMLPIPTDKKEKEENKSNPSRNWG